MSSRKIYVVLLLVLTILWGFSASDVRAQAKGESKAVIAVPDAPADVPAATPAPATRPAPATPSEYVPLGAEERRIFQEARQKVQQEMQKAQQEMQKAQIKVEQLQRQLGNYDIFKSTGGGTVQIQRSGRGIVTSLRSPGGRPLIGTPFVPGAAWTPFGAFEDEETKALQEKENGVIEETEEIVDQYNSSQDKEEREKLKKKLEEVVSNQFQIRQEYRELQVKRLETELARIRETIQKRNDNREKIINRRIAQLLHEEDGLEF